MNYFALLDMYREPFSNSPDPEFFYNSLQHMECVQQVEIAVRLRRGLNLITGQVGAGKTTICRQFIRQVAADARIKTCLILDPSFDSARELLAELAFMLTGERSEATDSQAAIKERIKTALLAHSLEAGQLVVLLIDEGQKLTPECLEALRELLNYETNEYKLLQIVIFAQAEIEEQIATRENFVDRINLHYRLGPLNLDDMREMVRFRLRKSSVGDAKACPQFTEAAFVALHTRTGGFPRKVVQACHKLLLAAIVGKTSVITGEMVAKHVAHKGQKTMGAAACDGAESRAAPNVAAGRRWRAPVSLSLAAAMLFAVFVFRPQGPDSPQQLMGSLSGLVGAKHASALPTSDMLTAAVNLSPRVLDVPIIGQVRLGANESLEDLARLLYGPVRPELLEQLRKANANLIGVAPASGTLVNVPWLGAGIETTNDGYGVTLGEYATLQEALDTLRQVHGALALQLAIRDGGGAPVFVVTSGYGFASEEEVEAGLAGLPPHLSQGASVHWGVRARHLTLDAQRPAGKG